MTKYIVRFDDFYVGMEKENLRGIEILVRENSLPAIVGVVPAWQDALPVREPVAGDEFWEAIRAFQTMGCEIALHGYTHRLFRHENLLDVNPYGEFAGLPYREQYDRIQKGLQVFRDNGVATRMFMPPAHSFDLNTIRALRSSNIELVTDGKSFYPYRYEGVLFLPQISSGLRTYPWGVITICLHPQWLTDDFREKLVEFVRSRRVAVVSVQNAVVHFQQMSRWTRAADAGIRKLYSLTRRLRRRHEGIGKTTAHIRPRTRE